MTAAIQPETPKELFRELVEKALARREVEPDSTVAFYLVTLLDDFIRPESIARRAGLETESTLAELFCTAIGTEGARRLTLLKYTGDLALFVSGFFSDSLAGKTANVDYYIRMGSTAYGTAAAHTRRPILASVFDELAREFAGFVDVLGEVSERCAVNDETNLLRLYERWKATGSPRTAAVLRGAGVVLRPGQDDLPAC